MRNWPVFCWLLPLSGFLVALAPALGQAQETAASREKVMEALRFHAGFEGNGDAVLAPGDKRIFTVESLARKQWTPGIARADVVIAKGQGMKGDCLRFGNKAPQVICFKGESMPYSPKDWSGTVSGRMDQRIIKGREEIEELDGTPGDGQVLLWSRIPEVIEGIDAATLAILGDFVPMGVGQSLGIRGGGNSLDNTLRIGTLVPTEWVLLDIRIHMVGRGFGHGLVHMFAEDGTLMATASQSCIVRFWRDMPGPGPAGKAKK